MVVFGDSLSDTGNVPSAIAWDVKGFKESNGRFTSDPTSSPPSSNTGVWHEELAAQLGIPAATAASAGGQNWATGGAETGQGDETGAAWFTDVLNYPYGFPNVGQQISDFFGQAMVFPDNTLYAIWAGGNDLIAAADNAQSSGQTPGIHDFESTAAIALTNITTYINQLITNGSSNAKFIIWPNLPELDQIPHAQGAYNPGNPLNPSTWNMDQGYSPSVNAALADAVQTFNTDWALELGQLRRNNPNVTFYGLDVHSLFNEMLNGTYPGYSFSNVTTEAWPDATLGLVTNADTYLFWDGMHPTEKAHQLLGDAAASCIKSGPSATVATPSGTVSGNVSVGYNLASTAEWATCSVTAQYSTDGGASWHVATSGPGGSGTSGLAVTPSGNPYTFLWNSSADIGASLSSNVFFKITPTDAAGVGTAGATSTFAVDDRNSPPVIGSLTASPEPVALGNNLTLTASNVVDTDGSVVSVQFYRDVNGNGSIDVGTDQFLGTGTQSGSTWTWTGATTGFTLGTDTYMAVATDNSSASSNTATTTGTVYPAGGYVVNSTADTVAVDGYVTLREAILAANSNTAVGDAHAGSSSTTDVIVFSSSLDGQTINLTAGELPISDNLTIIGPGADQLTINAGGLSRIFDVTASKTVTISGLTLNGGSMANGGGAIYNSSGTVSLSALTITASSASSGGGVSSAGGVLTLSNSTIYGNSTTGSGSGGGLAITGGQAIIDQSTVSGNSATGGNGGGIYSTTTGALTVRQCTIALNSARQGGGIYAQNALPLLTNTLVAQDQASLSGADVYGGFSLSSSYNLIGVIDSTATGLTTDPHTQAGTAAVPLDPMLGLLGNNGGPTPTHSLLTGSLAIDAGSNALALDASGNPLTIDERGQARIAGTAVDIGATEGSLAPGLVLTGPANGTSIDIGQNTVFTWDPRTIPVNGLIQLYLDPDATVNGNELPVAVNLSAVAASGQLSWAPTLQPAGQYTVGGSVTDPLSGQTWSGRMTGKVQITYTNLTIVNSVSDVVASDNLTTLREAILQSNANPRAGGGLNVILFDPSLAGQTITLSGFDLPITANVDILGPGQTLLTVDGNNQTDVFNVSAGVQAVFSDLTVSHGANSAIRNAGTTTLERVTVNNSHDQSNNGGGGIYNTGMLTADASTISGNNGYNGGGIYNNGVLTVTNSTIKNNTAYSSGGGIWNNGTLTISNSTISGNSGGNGGGIYGGGSINNCVVSGNTASGYGGGIYASNAMTVSGTTVSGNTAYYGGGVYSSSGALTVTNSTICTNTANSGGGIYDGYGPMGLYQVTISGNSAGGDGGGVYIANNSSNTVNIYQSTIAQNQSSGNGGGVANGYAGTNVAVFNTIIANNAAAVAGPDARGTFSTSSSHNLIGIVDGSNGLGNDPASREGTLASPLDAGLGVLASNGGPTVGDQIHGNGQPTLTQGLLPTSPALSAGSVAYAIGPSGQALTTDQRGAGHVRVQGGAVDIGAVEGAFADATLRITGPTGSVHAGTREVLTWGGNTPASSTISLYADPDGTVNGNEYYIVQNVPIDALLDQQIWFPVLPAGS
jgi:CSLREA domain-containing protein